MRQRVLCRTGRPLAEGRTTTAHVPRVVRRIEGGDPRFWVLVAMHTPPPRLTFVASDLRLSKNLNWRSPERMAKRSLSAGPISMRRLYRLLDGYTSPKLMRK